MITVHMIGNAHLDPVWLWRKADGVDTALATARSACDRLDEYPHFVFSCSGRWFHEQVEQLDPALFGRVGRFVAAGRWLPVGGMVIQPDCNLPSRRSFARQLEAGQGYYRQRFGQATTVGYNVDSFGHTAYLPGLLRGAGIDCYVFMRPGPHEKRLPARLFRWRGPDGAEVVAFRIAGAYCIHQAELREHIARALEDLPAGVEHTMCFFGVGDHGGGPTKAQIEWIADNAEAIPGARLVFSHPRAFFDAVAAHHADLPVVADELQHHAVGCYTVQRRIKVALRRAEARLQQAEQTVDVLGGPAAADASQTIDDAWRAVLFNQFHDILGGTSLDGPSLAAAGEMIAAEARADDVITALTRRAFRDRARPGEHRVVVLNPSARPFDGYIEHEPWLQFGRAGGLDLLDEDGRSVPFQRVEQLALAGGLRRVLLRLAVPACGQRMLRFVERPPGSAGEGAAPAEATPQVEGDTLASGPLEVRLGGQDIRAGGWIVRLEVRDDPTDTWSHSAINRFAGRKVGDVKWHGEPELVETGPIRSAVRLGGGFRHSRVWCRAMVLAGEAELRLRLSIVWAEVRRLLRLRIEAPGPIVRRTDLVSGGPIVRPVDRLEYPLSGGLFVETSGEAGNLAVIAPEVFSAGVDRRGVSLTLLRSPFLAHHDPAPADARPDQPVADQGSHEIEVRLRVGCPADAGVLEEQAQQMLMPPIVWDLTG